MSLPNTNGYDLISAEYLKELSEACYGVDNVPFKLMKAIHEPSLMPAILIDWDDGRKEYYTIETANTAKGIQ